MTIFWRVDKQFSLQHNETMSRKEESPHSLKGHRIEKMFSGIAPWYDFLNHLLSLQRDVVWRQELVQGLQLGPGSTVLDLAAGTLDVSLEIVRQRPDSVVAAADFSLAMLAKGKEKLTSGPGAGSILPVAADAYALPFPAAHFDALTIAFGIRNVPDRLTALREMHRVLRPGGIVGILEFIPPDKGWLQNLYKLYLNGVLPIIGRIFSQHAFAYSYLAESINQFPKAGEFCRYLAEAGFDRVQSRVLTFGIVGLFYGEKAGPSRNRSAVNTS
jgi:demethylmenaquinone methyltransferase/2-methoxy-6-polyprenyl-1,4-benzoquinol methylase